MTRVRVGTRGSKLALTQTGHVVDALCAAHPDLECEIVVVHTTGDARQNMPFTEVGTKGMFVKELEEALLSGQVDLAVHSMKDMPGELAEGLALAAVPAREDARDALVSRGSMLRDLPAGATIGTSSLRRRVLLKIARPDIVVDELRGNLDTRLRKLDEGHYDAIVLACAGMARMGWSDRITERLAIDVSIPAPGQGVLALETRRDDEQTLHVLSPLHDSITAITVVAERAFQAALGAGCSVPAGGHATVEDGHLAFIGFLSEPDGTDFRRVEQSGPAEQAADIGRQAALILLGRSR